MISAVDTLRSETHCFGIFKPDAIEQGIVPEVEDAIERAGLSMLARRVVQLCDQDVLTIWPVITNPHASRTVPYMTSAPVELFGVTGEEASDKMLRIKRSVRERYPNPNPVITVLHTTDHDEELRRCMQHFFGDNSYE